MAIPRIIHQIWNTDAVPDKFKAFRESCFKHHPDWQYRLWTAEDQRVFLKQYYPWFLPLFDAYTVPIKRADVVRYFLLWHYGGVYADLDMEFLKPIDSLLAGKKLILGKEPDAHLLTDAYKELSLDFLLCNAVMASVPGHSFWGMVVEEVIARRFVHLVVDSTGPLMLTYAYKKYSEKENISIEPSDVFYPVTQMESLAGIAERLDYSRLLEKNAHAIHHWSGSWSEEDHAPPAEPRCYVLDFMRNSAKAEMPMVSCLMATRNRLEMSKRAIHCFQIQSWPNKELVIVDNDDNDELFSWVQKQNVQEIRYVKLTPQNRSLGELRNISAKYAAGEYVLLWSDDEISFPSRLKTQMNAIRKGSASACFLHRHRIWFPEKRLFIDSSKRLWEESVVCKRSKIPTFPDICGKGDTLAVMDVVACSRVVVLDAPDLYTRVSSGKNSAFSNDIEKQIKHATRVYRGAGHHCLRRRMELDCKLSIVGFHDMGPMMPAAVEELDPEDKFRTVKDVRISSEGRQPTIHVMIPLRNGEHRLDGLFVNLDKLTCPHDRLTVSFLVGNSKDDTYRELKIYEENYKTEFAGFNVLEKPDKNVRPKPIGESGRNAGRNVQNAEMRNFLLMRVLKDEDYVLWLDAEVIDWPEDIIETMLAAEKEIVVPHCVGESATSSFDPNTWKFKKGNESSDEFSTFSENGSNLQRRADRAYLDDFRGPEPVRLDSVGATMMLIRADVHRGGLIFPPFKYHNSRDEMQGVACLARDMGYNCYGLPHVKIKVKS